MSLENICRLSGSVQADPLAGANWTRYNRNQRGQVRFWLAVSRDLAGQGLDVLLCAIEPATVEELERYQAEIKPGRTVELAAHARATFQRPNEDHPGVIFVAESCGFGGGAVLEVHHKQRQGKMAAAADDSGAELPLEVAS